MHASLPLNLFCVINGVKPQLSVVLIPCFFNNSNYDCFFAAYYVKYTILIDTFVPASQFKERKFIPGLLLQHQQKENILLHNSV